MVTYFDIDRNGYISFNEFLMLVLTTENHKLREDACQRVTYKPKPSEFLHPKVEHALSNFLEREIELHIKLEASKKQLHFCPNWNIKAVFNLLDNKRRGVFTAFELKEFFNLLGYEASSDELFAIIRRIEGRKKDHVCFEDLIMALDPAKV